MSLEIGFQTETLRPFSQRQLTQFTVIWTKSKKLEFDTSLLHLSGGSTGQKWEFAVAGFLRLPAPKSYHGDLPVVNAQP